MTAESLCEEVISLEPAERDKFLRLLIEAKTRRDEESVAKANRIVEAARTNVKWYTMEDVEKAWAAQDAK